VQGTASAIRLNGEICGLVKLKSDLSVRRDFRLDSKRFGTYFYLLERSFGRYLKADRFICGKRKELNDLTLIDLPLMTGPTAVKRNGRNSRYVKRRGESVYSNNIIVTF
jgi:hypothetical protein